LSSPREIVARREQILRTGIPIDVAQRRDGVVLAGDRTILVGVAEFRGEEVDQPRVDPVGIVLLRLRKVLLIVGGEIKQLILADGTPDRAAELLLREGR